MAATISMASLRTATFRAGRARRKRLQPPRSSLLHASWKARAKAEGSFSLTNANLNLGLSSDGSIDSCPPPDRCGNVPNIRLGSVCSEYTLGGKLLVMLRALEEKASRL